MIKQSINGKGVLLYELYKSNLSYYKEFVEFIEKVIKSFSSFGESLNNIFNKKNNFTFFEDKTSIFYDLMKILKSHFQLQSEELKDFTKAITKEIIEPFKSFKSVNDKSVEDVLKNIYELSKRIKKEKSCLEDNQNIYYTKMKETEKLIIEEISMKGNQFSFNQEIKNKKSLAYVSTYESILDEEKYFKTIKEVNNLNEQKRIQEKKLLNFYQDFEKKRLDTIKENYFYFLTNIKSIFSKFISDIDEIIKKFINFKLENNINKLIKNYKIELSSEKKIEFIPYTPFSSLDNSMDNISQIEQININYEVILNLQQHFKKICENLNMTEEKEKNNLRVLCVKMFLKNQEDFVKKDKDELLKYMQNKEYRNFFLKFLTYQRTNGKYKKEEKLFSELLEIMEEILLIAEKEKNFDNARNCIILSQTFYKEKKVDGNNTKVYLMEYIKKNKWISSPIFWKEFIENEIIKDEAVFLENKKLNKIEDKTSKVSKIYYSKLLTYAHNMNMFGLTKQDNLDTINYFFNKIKIPEKTKENILNTIESLYSDKKEIKIKKEINKKENIQKEDNKEIQKQKENISKEDVKNEDLNKIQED